MDPIYYYFIPVLIVALSAGSFLVEGLGRRVCIIFLAMTIMVYTAPQWRPRLDSLLAQNNSVIKDVFQAKPQVLAASPAEPFKPFYVYKDKPSNNRFVPSGYMADGACVSVDDAWQIYVKEGRSCMQVIYDTACSGTGRKWAGVYWQNPANNWGRQKGGYDLTGATRLVFWARGEQGGEHILEFKVGGLGLKETYPDSVDVGIKDIVLTKEWKEYVIDLRGRDLSYISGGFAWITNVDVNSGPCIFYLDDIRFE
jgi:hypothetical protein